MSQEHRLCAEIYARIFDHVDQAKRIAISPDGRALLPRFPRLSVPDLCFTLIGSEEVRIEAKLLKDQRRIEIQPNQRADWFGVTCEVVPHYWLISTVDLTECWLLEHGDVAARIETKVGENTLLNLWPNMKRPKGKSLNEISRKIRGKRLGSDGATGESDS